MTARFYSMEYQSSDKKSRELFCLDTEHRLQQMLKLYRKSEEQIRLLELLAWNGELLGKANKQSLLQTADHIRTGIRSRLSGVWKLSQQTGGDMNRVWRYTENGKNRHQKRNRQQSDNAESDRSMEKRSILKIKRTFWQEFRC